MATTAPLTLVQQDPGDKRRQALAGSMMGGAIQYRPMRTGWEAIGNMAQAYAGAKIGEQADTDYQQRQQDARDTLAQAFANRMNPPAPYGSAEEAFYGTLATNKDTANLASQMKLNQVVGQQEALSRPPNLTKMYDPASPTGTALIDPMNMKKYGYGPPGSQGLQVGFNPGGGISSLSLGGTGITPAGDVSAPTSRTTGTVQDKAFNTSEYMNRLTRIEELYRPEFQQIPTRFSMWGAELKDRFGELDPKDKQQLTEFATYRKSAVNNLNLLFNELSGAAVSPDEAVRLKGGVPNPGTGIFDGDSPTVFNSALQESIRATKQALIRYNLWMKVGDAGGNPWDIPFSELPAKINEYARGIERELAPRYQDRDELIGAVKVRMRAEGLAF